LSHISSSFLYRFLDDVWDLLPKEDRDLFESYWKGQVRIASNMETKVLEAGQSVEVAEVPVFLTERWNRYVMDEDTTDQFSQTDSLTLILLASATLSRETVFFDTLKVTNSSGQIQHEETMRFFDEGVRTLRYGKLIKGTISLKLEGFEFTPNRDYVINEIDGTIQALDNGRIPTTALLTVTYQHEEYTRDLDYIVDEARFQIARTAISTIGSGDTVAVVYTYNGTATLPLQGTSAAVDTAILTDESKNFSTLLPGRTLTIASGDNAGTYAINSVISVNKIQIAGLFPTVQESDVVYSINAFPHGVKISTQIKSVPVLQDLVDDPTSILVEGVDYVVSGGILSSRTALLKSAIGPVDTRKRQAWAEETKIDDETPYRNFGVLIDFYRENSEEYKLALQGLWFTFWTGSTPGNLQRGLHILLGLPFTRRSGTVSRVDTDLGEIDITEASGRILTYSIPDGLDSTVERGDEVSRFEALTTGVEIIDRNNEPGFVTNRLGRAGIAKFLTDGASTGPGDTDETKALELLEHHLFLPQVLVEAITQKINVAELVTFLDNMKPQWTEYVFSFAVDESETISFSEVLDPIAISIDLSTTIDNNELNKSVVLDEYFLHKTTGEVLGAGSQATGNFRDLTQDYVALGVDTGYIVRIDTGIFKGYHLVLERQSSTVLSLDIPDAALQSVIGLEYWVFTEEQAVLDHDSVQIRKEHTLLPGTDYPAPATLNSATDVDMAGLGLANDEVKALLLVDIGIAGGEVQAITDADVSTGEFDVGSPPGTVTRNHEIASAALKRTDNSGPTVTDAYAI
jgi:archaellum component FlaF (FlaF/FlaG flagellin family)